MRKIFSLLAAVLFAGSMMAETYTKTDFANLNNGATVIITMQKGTDVFAASNDKGTTAAPTAVAVSVANDAITTDATNILWTVVKDGDNITFAATDTSALYCTNTNNGMRVGKNTNNVFSIDATSGYLFNNATSRYVGVYNSQDFRCYTSVNSNISGQTLAFYAKGGEAPAVATPVITGDAVFFDSTIVTMTCSTQDADIYYTTDGTTDPKCDCAAAPEYKKPLVLKATTTIKAAAYTGNDWSAVAEKVFTKAPSFASFEALIAAELPDKTIVEVSFENVKIDSFYVSSQSKKQGLYFTVNEKAYEIYYNKAEVPEAWEVGGTVSGTIRGNWTVYKGLWEIVPSANDWAWALTYNAPAPAHTYTVAGAPSTVFGDNWNPALEANDMQQLIGGDGYIWSKDTAEVSVGALVFKVVEDHSWDNKAYPAENYILELEPAYYNIVITFNPAAQPDSMVKVIAKKVGELPVVGVETVYNWAKDAADQVGTTAYGTGTEVSTVKIHTNTLSVDAIKFGSSYVYADSKYIAIKPAEGGFKAGDELSVMVWFSNADDSTKYCMVDVFAADGATRLFRSDSASTVNGRLHNEDAAVQTYVLASDQDSLLIGRYGNTGMFVTLLKVTRALVPPTPEHTYTVAGAPATLFGTAWAPANEANDMKPITGSKYLYAWEKDSVALTAGDIEFKVCEDHAWTKAWPAQNYKLNIAEAGLYKVSIFFNPEFGDSAVYAMAEKKGEAKVLPNIILHGNFTGTWADTDPFVAAQDSLTASLTLALAAGNYEFGFKFDGTWKANGANLTREDNTANLSTGEGNMHITADVAGDYVFTYTYATQDVVVTYPEPIIVPDTIDVTMSSLTAPGSLIWDDEVATEGWWQIMGGNDTCQFSLSNGNEITTAAGTYTVADLDPKYSYITVVKANDTIDVAFVEGSITVAVNEAGVVTIVGALLGNDDNVYNFNLTYVEPKAETTVNVNIAEGKMNDVYADYGLYGVYGTDTTANVFVQLAIWAEDGFQGNFTEKDLDFKYVGSGIVEGLTAPNIYTAAITVTPGNGGDYNITADILCYNNKLYKVTMYIPGAQGIDAVEAATKAIKSLQNGILTIEKAGKTYNVNGTLIR